MSIAVSDLKAKQDVYDAQVKLLREHFIAFRKGFFERLTEFTREAVAAGLRGVTPFKLRSGYDDRVVADVVINSFPLIIVSSDDVWPVTKNDNRPALRILMYREDAERGELAFDIIATKQQNDTYKYETRAFSPSSDTIFPLRLGELSEDGGRASARELISEVYQFRSYWNPKPLLHRQLDRSGSTDSIGFKLPTQ